MKNLLLLLCFMGFTFGYSQDIENSVFNKNEIKVNFVFLIVGAVEVTYERLLNEKSGVGLALFVPYDETIDNKLSLTSYYRYYFGKKPGAGFFAEGFGMLNSHEYSSLTTSPDGSSNSFREKKPDFALGLGIGRKWISKKGFLIELNFGIGKNLFHSDENSNFPFVGRGIISLGYRFGKPLQSKSPKLN